jgi:hypothetical protein
MDILAVSLGHVHPKKVYGTYMYCPCAAKLSEASLTKSRSPSFIQSARYRRTFHSQAYLAWIAVLIVSAPVLANDNGHQHTMSWTEP